MRLKNHILRNPVPLVFIMITLIGIILTKATPYALINEALKGFLGYAVIVLALLLPVLAGMGFNFGIIIGAMTGQLGIIMIVNWGIHGVQGFVVALLLATCFAFLAGVPIGLLINKARGHEMITSYFAGMLGNGIYQFILLTLVGGIIPFASSELLLGSGIGLKNAISLDGTLLRSVDSLLEIPLFLMLMALGILFLGLGIYKVIMKKSSSIRQTTFHIAVSSMVILISAMIHYVPGLPIGIGKLSTIKFPVVTGLLTAGIVALIYYILDLKQWRVFNTAPSDTVPLMTADDGTAKARVTVILISTVLAAWGQIILLQSTGAFSTYGSHSGVAFIAVEALILGGATFKKAGVKNALLGLFLFQCFNVVATLTTNSQLFGNSAEFIRVIALTAAIVYTFAHEKNEGLLD